MSTLRTTTLQDAAGNNSVPMATVAAGTAKAWVNFNGTGTVAIRASFNVTSITDINVGDYRVNFTTAMPDANYSMCGMCSNDNIMASFVDFNQPQQITPSATVAPIEVVQISTNTRADRIYVYAAFFR